MQPGEDTIADLIPALDRNQGYPQAFFDNGAGLERAFHTVGQYLKSTA